jgi:hypothetical protein
LPPVGRVLIGQSITVRELDESPSASTNAALVATVASLRSVLG